MKEQNFNDNTLYNETLQIQQDFTTLEQLKIAKNLIGLVCTDMHFNVETIGDEKTCNELNDIWLQLKEIINKYDKGE